MMVDSINISQNYATLTAPGPAKRSESGSSERVKFQESKPVKTETYSNAQKAMLKSGKEEELEQKDINKLDEKIAELNAKVESTNRNLKFNVHKESGRVQVKVIDSSNNKVIKEIPPKEMLDLISRMHKMEGLLFNKSA